ncbi:MAG: hypothetical protein ACM3X4_02575 [Ignavibacteriales bacterium]
MEKSRYRTQLYLDEAQYRFLRETAARHETSIAGVVRDLIDREMGSVESVDKNDPLFRATQDAIRTGRTDGSVAHDHYIYREPQRNSTQRASEKGSDGAS